MFGRAKFVDGKVLFNEMLDAIHVVSFQIDNLEFDFNDHDYERMTVWNTALVVYCVKMWGRTNDSSMKDAFTSYMFHLKENDADSSSLMQQFTAGLQCLGRNLREFEIEDIERAANDFRQGFEVLRRGYGMPGDEFNAWAVSSFVVTVERLAEKKLIRFGK